MAFSASEAAFEGFRIIRREPKAAVVWGVFLLVVSVASALLLLPFTRAATAGFGVTPGARPSPAVAAAIVGQVGRLYLVLIPVWLIVSSVFSAAIYRAVLRPRETGFGRLRLGGDELRLVGLYLLMGVFFMALGIVVTLVGTMIGIGVSMALKSSAGGVGIVVGMVYLLMLIIFLWVGVRLSFAAPMTFAESRIRLFPSWRATKGRFWPLFGCYLLAWIFAALVLLVDLAVSGALAFGMNGGSMTRAVTQLMRPDYSSVGAMFTPLYILRLLVGAAFGVVMWTVMAAAPAAAYRAIAATKPEDQAETFA